MLWRLVDSRHAFSDTVLFRVEVEQQQASQIDCRRILVRRALHGQVVLSAVKAASDFKLDFQTTATDNVDELKQHRLSNGYVVATRPFLTGPCGGFEHFLHARQFLVQMNAAR